MSLLWISWALWCSLSKYSVVRKESMLVHVHIQKLTHTHTHQDLMVDFQPVLSPFQERIWRWSKYLDTTRTGLISVKGARLTLAEAVGKRGQLCYWVQSKSSRHRGSEKRCWQNWWGTEDNRSSIHSINNANCHPVPYFSQLSSCWFPHKLSPQILLCSLWLRHWYGLGPLSMSKWKLLCRK